MFVSGQSMYAGMVFSILSFLIAVPSAIKVFNWTATLYKGSIRYTTPMLYSLAFVALFTIGGHSGLYLAGLGMDLHVHDTYFVIAHFHFIMVGAQVSAFLAGLHFWWPKMTGKFLSEGIGKLQFWLMIVGANLAFMPMHYLGIQGMPRRIETYSAYKGWGFVNFIETIGAFMIAFSVLLFIINVVMTIARKKDGLMADDPWEGNTLEWATTSPPPSYNFATIPVVSSVRPVRDTRLGIKDDSIHY